jgi:hypothetical protein
MHLFVFITIISFPFSFFRVIARFVWALFFVILPLSSLRPLVMTEAKITKIGCHLTQGKLDDLCRDYHIPSFVNPTLPDPGQAINQYPPGKIGLYSLFLIMLTSACLFLCSLLMF